MSAITLHHARFDALSGRQVHDLLALRSAIFVVEQDCPYLDADGRDVDPTTVHHWATDGPVIVATLRWLRDADSGRIGRVVTDATHRGAGLAGQLMSACLEASEGPIVLDAQSHLADWYGRFGFIVSGPEYPEDGIPHLPMRLDRDGAPRHR